jgi:hypothetical protein
MKTALIIGTLLSLVLVPAQYSLAGADPETAVTSHTPASAAPFSVMAECVGEGTCPPSVEIREAHESAVGDIRTQPCGRGPC